MKKSLFTLLILIITLLAVNDTQAQYRRRHKSDNKFKVGLAGLYALSTDKGLGGDGVGFYVHPQYNVNEQFSVGLQAGVILSSAEELQVEDLPEGAIEPSDPTIIPVLLTGEFYFSDRVVRPFIGLGVGMYKMSAVTYKFDDNFSSIDSFESEPINNYGLAPKLGLQMGPVDLSVAYHMTGEGIADFATFNLGFTIGGGKRR
ncbi:outer membrane beta-barrel protein [Limibacter armeniacum]|uniref:outer membrane beta-barrel protein n=1 Tax=Limibacter armeniacum TaxID=466084 RepID=UPI002FE61679